MMQAEEAEAEMDPHFRAVTEPWHWKKKTQDQGPHSLKGCTIDLIEESPHLQS